MALKKNLDELVFDRMRDRIINGEWEQGQSLEVDELSAFYEVSRTPVLQALKRMQNEGMVVVSRSGKFFFPTYDARQVRDVCRVRLLLELEAVDEIGNKQIALDIDSLRGTARRCHQVMTREDITGSRRLDLEWHKALVASAGNECLTGLYTKVLGQFMVANYLQTFHTKQQQLVAADDHLKILDSLERGDFEGAKAGLREHIDQACEKIILRIRQRG